MIEIQGLFIGQLLIKNSSKYKVRSIYNIYMLFLGEKEGMRLYMKIEDVIRYFPIHIYSLLKDTLEKNKQIEENLQEIRVRVNRPILLKLRQADILIQYQINRNRDFANFRKIM